MGEYMKVVQGIESFRHGYSGDVYVALGNFDGVHLGHRRILASTVNAAVTAGSKSAVLIFTPHPLSLLSPHRAPQLLQSVEERIEMLGNAGIDYVIVHPFTRAFASVVPELFAVEILHGKLAISGVVVGYDYSFGRQGSGTPHDLRQLGERLGFSVDVISPVAVDGVPVGSSLIRSYLTEGRVEAAAVMLGYPFTLSGTVVHGDGRGRQLGFPTANIQTPCDIIRPGNGVYLSKAVLKSGTEFWALTNVGKRPTFCKTESSVEVYLIDATKNLYGEELRVVFLQKIREEKAFNSAMELTEQIKQDVRLARDLIPLRST